MTFHALLAFRGILLRLKLRHTALEGFTNKQSSGAFFWIKEKKKKI
jgi:hypothetical protein